MRDSYLSQNNNDYGLLIIFCDDVIFLGFTVDLQRSQNLIFIPVKYDLRCTIVVQSDLPYPIPFLCYVCQGASS